MDVANLPKAQAAADFMEGAGIDSNPYPYHSQDWWDYQIKYAQCCGDEAKGIHEELRSLYAD